MLVFAGTRKQHAASIDFDLTVDHRLLAERCHEKLRKRLIEHH